MEKELSMVIIVSVISGGLTIALSAMVAALGQAKAIAAALEGVARNPEAQSKIQTVMLIGLAFIESLALYALFISIMLVLLNPFIKYFTGASH